MAQILKFNKVFFKPTEKVYYDNFKKINTLLDQISKEALIIEIRHNKYT